ncbi:DUF6615 family protein [Peribacillus sp. Bi134]|uniref:DUF6615 family protein n=1 Tax=Peribacillus sp. Bi134 TaxID=2884272 RepID=UPI001E0871B8|nr:DUF6615 family protein [Peribacillus sp. Bi134]CAH0283381.1 hypothetical protein SRABI134_04097 [Peribacillus sp. Bi134]
METKSTLIKEIKRISCEIWDQMHEVIQLQQGANEPSITSSIFSELKKLERKGLSIAIATRTESPENITGADIEWWLEEEGKFIALSIQAKRLYSNDEYSQLDYYVGEEKKPQIDILIEYAEQNKMIPLYSFYNFIQYEGGSDVHTQHDKAWTYAYAHDLLNVKTSSPSDYQKREYLESACDIKPIYNIFNIGLTGVLENYKAVHESINISSYKHSDCPSYIKELKRKINDTMLYTTIEEAMSIFQGHSTRTTPPPPKELETNQKIFIYTNLTPYHDHLKALGF